LNFFFTCHKPLITSHFFTRQGSARNDTFSIF